MGTCPYGALFAASLTHKQPPFAIYLFPVAHASSEVKVEITLFGVATANYSAVITALTRAFAGGIGPQRQRYRLDAIQCVRSNGELELLSNHGQAVSAVQNVQPDALVAGPPISRGDPSITIHLLSPTRLKDGERLLKKAEPVLFPVLVKRIVSRLKQVYELNTDAYLPLSMEDSAEVSLIDDKTKWIDVRDV
jgi:hypothetical protein